MRLTRWLRRGIALAGIGTAGSVVVITARYLWLTPQPLKSGLTGEARIDRHHGSDIYYTIAGPEGSRPLVLLHDFYPGASSYEYASVLPRLARDFRVYAPDWLGFGMSEHPALAYTGEFYAGMLEGFLRDIVTQPAIVIAQGRAANIAARAASDAPALFDRLVLVSPRLEAGLHLDPTPAQALVRLAERVSLGLVPYALLSTRPALRLLASRRGMGAASEDVVDHEWDAAHQFGAQHAALATLTGELDLPLQHLLPTLEPPVLLVAGEQDSRRTHDDMEELAVLRPYTDLDIIPGAAAAVCQDQPARFAKMIEAWIERALPRHASTDTLRMGSPDATSVGASQPAVSAAPPPRPVKPTSRRSAAPVDAPTAATNIQPERSPRRSNDAEQGAAGAVESSPEPAMRRAASRLATKPPVPVADTSTMPEPASRGLSGRKSSSRQIPGSEGVPREEKRTLRRSTLDNDKAAQRAEMARTESPGTTESPVKRTRKSAPNGTTDADRRGTSDAGRNGRAFNSHDGVCPCAGSWSATGYRPLSRSHGGLSSSSSPPTTDEERS